MRYFVSALAGPMSLMRLRPTVAQLATPNLADIALGQFSPELDDLRPLVAGQLRFAVGEDVRISERLVLFHDEQLYRFSRMLIRHTDRGDFEYPRHLGNHVFDLVRVDVEAGDQNHVLLPIDDLD